MVDIMPPDPDSKLDPCSCGHAASLHPNEDDPACAAIGCPCSWLYEGRSDWGYMCSQYPHHSVEFYGPDSECGQCGYRPTLPRARD